MTNAIPKLMTIVILLMWLAIGLWLVTHQTQEAPMVVPCVLDDLRERAPDARLGRSWEGTCHGVPVVIEEHGC